MSTSDDGYTRETWMVPTDSQVSSLGWMASTLSTDRDGDDPWGFIEKLFDVVVSMYGLERSIYGGVQVCGVPIEPPWRRWLSDADGGGSQSNAELIAEVVNLAKESGTAHVLLLESRRQNIESAQTIVQLNAEIAQLHRHNCIGRTSA